MSSIYGWWNLDKKPIPATSLSRIEKDTSWWNPGAADLFHNQSVALGFLRFDINSKNSTTKDNCVHTENNVSICADVRLDNREELIKKLSVRDSSISDSLLILKAYLTYGEDCLHHLIGAFAFAIWDASKKEFFCARDHIGIKPFNYYFHNHQFLFGSQRKSILRADNVDKSPDWKFIILKLDLRMSVEDRTENLYIKKLLPAHYLKINKDGLSIKRYWNLDIHSEVKYANDQDYVDHFLELFKESIKARMRGSSKVSAHMSGGLDSTGIAAVSASLTQSTDVDFHAYAYAFPEVENLKLSKRIFNFNPDLKKQMAFSNITNGHLITKPIHVNFKKRIDHETMVCDGLSWSNNVFTEYELQHQAQQDGVGILFSGFLGDEIITSFCRPYYLEYLDKGQYGKFFSSKHQGKSIPAKLLFLLGLKFAKKLHIPINDNFFAKKYMSQKLKAKTKKTIAETHLFSPDFIAQNKSLQEALIEEYNPEIHHSIPLSLKEYQRNHINRLWTTRRIESETLSSMHFGLEYRYPMSDIRLLQYVLSVPVEQKRNDKFSRLLYRNAMEGYLIDEIRLAGKYPTHLKPLELYRKPQKDLSVRVLWENLKSSEAVALFDVNQIDEMLNYNKELGKFYLFAAIGNLILEDKLSL